MSGDRGAGEKVGEGEMGDAGERMRERALEKQNERERRRGRWGMLEKEWWRRTEGD